MQLADPTLGKLTPWTDMQIAFLKKNMAWYSTYIFHVGRSDVMAASWGEVSAKSLQDSREHPDERCELGKTLLWSGALFRRHREIIRYSS